MSWCDKLSAVPGVGFRLNPHFAPAASIFTALSKVLDPLYDDNKQQFRVSQQQPFDVQFNTDEGFNYAVEPTKLSVGFFHHMRLKPISGGVPTMELLSRAQPYTKFLPVVAQKAVDVAVLLNEQHKRAIDRLGIISSTRVADDDMPPGFSRFIEYMGRPWSGHLEDFNIVITAEIAKGNGYRDKCIHTITRPEDPEELIAIVLDWQRFFAQTQHPATRGALTPLVEDGQRAALKYFEDVGEGRRIR